MIKKFKTGDQVEVNIRNWTVGKSEKKQTPFVRISLTKGITWTGWLSPKALKYTIETLEKCGFKGSNLKMLSNDNALDTKKDLMAIIGEVREYNGKTYYDADFINTSGIKGFNDKNVDSSVLDELGDIDTRAYIDDAQDDDVPAVSDPEYDIQTDATFTADDIPF